MPRTTDTVERVRTRALELGVFLPLGAYDRLRNELSDVSRPNFGRLYTDLVDRGQERLRPVERVVRRRSADARKEAVKAAETTRSTARKQATKAGKRATAAQNTVAPKLPRVAAPRSASDLPIGGYDSLTASEIVAQLKGLTQTDIARIYKYEKAHEDRSTVLEAAESRFVELPIPTYDALSADEVVGRLEGLSQDELKTLKRYESDTKERSTVLNKIESLLGS